MLMLTCKLVFLVIDNDNLSLLEDVYNHCVHTLYTLSYKYFNMFLANT